MSDSNIADAQVITPTQVLVDGRSPGQTTLLVWDAQEHWRAYDVMVKLDVVEVVEEIKEIFPDQQINVSTAGSAVVLSGYVSSWEVAQRAGMVARAYNKNVVNALTYPPHLPWRAGENWLRPP
jgi:pilus assembly protein CpaC